MSIFCITTFVPEEYILALINSTFISHYVDNFVNNTQTFQINDARQLPIIVPTDVEVNSALTFVSDAISIKKNKENEARLQTIQKMVDKFVERLYHL
ncbi:Uncharacterised protein [Porphyromonas macacae]|uniref:Type I restriction modification DNA specificity domain-containing protein n=2 Tax=Porphyromonas macacae TaxID=28115 RepID=A0A379EBB9_9PORP|nr:hypothetical protein [Porphyromonas macacae]SUB77533.1 Uncharacterised protein [Porphyromonas macacae]SUB93709.1 Uncharacterised protein [Porphyromonas macacae]